VTGERERRWTAERLCFDGVASAAGPAPISPAAGRRFGSRRLRRAFFQEYMFRALGEVRGKCVLDLGCGRGRDAILLAKLGARVTGLDISPASVEFVTRCATAEGVAERTSVVCSPLETAPLPASAFDVIWCHNVLHHLTEELELVMERVTRWAKPGARVIITEPVSLCRALWWLRGRLPGAIATTGEDTWTEHERPLGREDIALLRRHVPGLAIRHFGFLGRAERFVLAGAEYEESPALRRLVAWLLAHADYGLLSLPLAKNIACRVVMEGRVEKRAA